MKTGYLWVFWSAMVLMVATAVTILAVITEHSLFRSTPLIYTLIMAITGTGLSLMMRNRFRLPLLRNMRLQGRLLLAPITLLVLSAPAAIIYIFYDISGNESLSLLSGLFTSLAAVFCLAFLIAVTLPSMAVVLHLLEERCGSLAKTGSLTGRTVTAISVIFLAVVLLRWLTGFTVQGLVLLLPIYALVMVILGIILSVDFSHALSAKLAVTRQSDIEGESSGELVVHVKGFRSILLFSDHYLDLASGRLDYLISHADEYYAREVVNAAGNAFDPALLPALRIITTESRFGEHLGQEAATVISNIEKYYSDPARNFDLLRLPGISEKVASARSIMLSRREPQVQEIIKLLGDGNADIRKTGIIATGKYGISELAGEMTQALNHHRTARAAWYVLRHFGPDLFAGHIGSAIRTSNTERENLMILRLLEMMPLSGALQYLNRFINAGHLNVRLKAAGYLCRQGYVPQGIHRKKAEEILNEAVSTTARLTAMELEARNSRYFILATALDYEKSVNRSFIFSLLTLLTGKSAADLIGLCSGDDTECGAGIASEAIDSSIAGELRKPLKALLGNNTDRRRLAELSLCYPLREIKGRSLASFILASEQNITGTWTKACALHKTAEAGGGIDRELAVSYLFSNIQLLQEESARAIRAINPDWYRDAEARLPEQVRNRLSAIISGSLPEAAMVFEKTRFLSLCFNNIPEEKTVILASAMRYSESYDAESLPGIISWIVPSQNGKSGLYSLPLSDIDDFVFYYSEYTDIFVHYMDNQGLVAVY
ncbi:MAG: hypothetical protein WAV93_01280 [Bacteroidales bacterium]